MTMRYRSGVSNFFIVAVVSLMGFTGCEDPKSMDWQIKHLADPNALVRSKAVEGISQSFRNSERNVDEKKKFREKALPELVKAYTSDVLKDSSKERRKLMEILSQSEDSHAKPAFVHALKNYKVGESEDEVKAAVRTIVKLKKDFAGDEDLGKALLENLKKIKFSDARSLVLGASLGDALSAIKPKSIKNDLLQIVSSPNDGQDTLANKENTARQTIAAQVLGEVGDQAIVAQLIDLMFDMASRQAKFKDPQTGEEIEKISPLTMGVSMVIGTALAKIGEPSVAPLIPFIKDDDKNATVNAVREKFTRKFKAEGKGNEEKKVVDKSSYIDIATRVLANIGLSGPIKKEVLAPLRKADTKDSERKAYVTLLVALPSDSEIIDVLKESYSKTKENSLKIGILESASRLMDPSLTDWLLQQASDKFEGDEETRTRAKTGALRSAEWLAPKSKMGELRTAFQKANLLEKADALWPVREATSKECDPKGKDRDKCGESPELKAADGTPKFVLYEDKTPKHIEVLKVLSDLTDKCDEKTQCYFDEFKAAVKEVDKQGLTKVTRAGTEAGIRMQKAIWMISAYGKEADMVELVKFMPSISSMAGRSFVQMALDKNLKQGSEVVAEAITKLVRAEREKGSETANREATQLEPIAHKLRIRTTANKK